MMARLASSKRPFADGLSVPSPSSKSSCPISAPMSSGCKGTLFLPRVSPGADPCSSVEFCHAYDPRQGDSARTSILTTLSLVVGADVCDPKEGIEASRVLLRARWARVGLLDRDGEDE